MPDTIGMYTADKPVYEAKYFRERNLRISESIANAEEKITKRWVYYFETTFPTKEMSSDYGAEKIAYLTHEGLESCQRFLVRNLLYTADGELYSSSRGINKASGTGEMVVMDHLGNIFIHVKQRGRVQHSSFFGGAPVSFAALIYVKEGRIMGLFRYSGHYHPGREEGRNWRTRLLTPTLHSRLIYDFLAHEQLRQYRCLLKPEEAWKGCSKCPKETPALKLLCEHVVCCGCYPTIKKCPVCLRKINRRAVSVEVGDDYMLFPAHKTCEDLSRELTQKYGSPFIAERPRFMIQGMHILESETLAKYRGKHLTLNFAPFGLVRGAKEIPDGMLRDILACVCESADGKHFPWEDVCNCFKLIFPHYALPRLRYAARELVRDGYDIPLDEEDRNILLLAKEQREDTEDVHMLLRRAFIADDFRLVDYFHTRGGELNDVAFIVEQAEKNREKTLAFLCEIAGEGKALSALAQMYSDAKQDAFRHLVGNCVWRNLHDLLGAFRYATMLGPYMVRLVYDINVMYLRRMYDKQPEQRKEIQNVLAGVYLLDEFLLSIST